MIIYDERDDLIAGLVDSMIGGTVIVPAHWRVEVASLMQIALKRKRLSIEGRAVAIATLSEFTINVDPMTDRYVWNASLDLADRHGLTIYDAAYLELAKRRGVPLASLDNDVRDAARAENVRLLGV